MPQQHLEESSSTRISSFLTIRTLIELYLSKLIVVMNSTKPNLARHKLSSERLTYNIKSLSTFSQKIKVFVYYQGYISLHRF